MTPLDDGCCRKIRNSSTLASSEAMWRHVRPLLWSCRKVDLLIFQLTYLRNETKLQNLSYLCPQGGAHENQRLGTSNVHTPLLGQLTFSVQARVFENPALSNRGVVGHDRHVQRGQACGHETRRIPSHKYQKCSPLNQEDSKHTIIVERFNIDPAAASCEAPPNALQRRWRSMITRFTSVGAERLEQTGENIT